MCCFGVRIFLLIFITVFSFGFHRLYPVVPVVGYYFILANLLAFLMMFLFFTARLPAFVKTNSMHYFSLIGGFLGSLLATTLFKKFTKDGFVFIELLICVLWLVVIAFLLLNFNVVSQFFQELIYANPK